MQHEKPGYTMPSLPYKDMARGAETHKAMNTRDGGGAETRI